MFLSHLSSSYFDRIPYGEDKYYLYSEVWTEYANALLSQVFFYTAIALAAIIIAVGVTVKLKKPEALKSFLHICGGLAGGFAVTVIVTMLAIGYAKISEKGYMAYPEMKLVLIPATVVGAVAVLGIAAAYVSSLFGKKAFKITSLTAASAFGAAFIALFVCLAVYYAGGNAEDNNGAVITVTENAVLYVSAAVIIAAYALAAVFVGRGEKKDFDSKSISYAAVCIAMSFALSYIKPIDLPQGGSVTLASLLPLMIYAYLFGVRKGLIAGFIYGTLQAVQDPWIIHPAQFLLDYPVAFTAMGLTGVFAKIKKLDRLPQVQFALGAVLAAVLRFACHVLSGVFAFSEYSTLDSVWAYSLAYNSFVFIDAIVCIAVGAIILSVKPFVKQLRGIQANAIQKATVAAAGEGIAPVQDAPETSATDDNIGTADE